MFTPPTHLFLVNVHPAQDSPTVPPLPGMPDPPHAVDVYAWQLDYGVEPEEREPEDVVGITPVVTARAVLPRRRLSPWTQAKRTVVASLEAMYASPDWSIVWATTKQAHSGRGRWKGHTEVLDHLADLSRDLAQDWLELGRGADLEAGHLMDSALADNGADPRNWVGLGYMDLPGATEPSSGSLPVMEEDGARWLSWN